MTIGIVYRVPGLGAVLGCDSRITDVNTGLIESDHDEKWLSGSTFVACFAGAIGGLWSDLREQPPRGWPELRRSITDLDATESHDRDYEVLVYDRKSDVIWHTSHQGDALRKGLYGAIGCGGQLALGALDASPAPKTLEAAERLVRRALKIACRRHSACGGRLRLLVVRGRRGAITVRANQTERAATR